MVQSSLLLIAAAIAVAAATAMTVQPAITQSPSPSPSSSPSPSLSPSLSPSPSVSPSPSPRLFLYDRPKEEYTKAKAGYKHWFDMGREEVHRAQARFAGYGLPTAAQNVILFVGDGMGVSTVTASRILKGQHRANVSGEEGYLTFEHFPFTGLLKTYSTDHQTADSAATATALLVGVKTRNGVLGYDEKARRGSCSSLRGARKIYSFMEKAAQDGFSVGMVTTTTLTHATPAAAYSHTPNRAWETPASMQSVRGSSNSACKDIISQFAEGVKNYRLVMAGGRGRLQNETVADWMRLQKQNAFGARTPTYIQTREQLMSIQTPPKFNSLLGLFADHHLKYDYDNKHATDSQREPSLREMATKAVDLLAYYAHQQSVAQNRSKGFVLLVEAGRIDHGHHETLPKRALHDTIALSDAVNDTMRLLERKGLLNDTLVAVTADHSHVFTLGHYGKRGQPILGLKLDRDSKSQQLRYSRHSDNLPLTVLNYADGKNQSVRVRRTWRGKSDAQLSGVDTEGKDFRFPSGMFSTNGESHGGEDVPVYATGPGAHLLQGVHEQTHVAHSIMYALGMHDWKDPSRAPANEAPPPVDLVNSRKQSSEVQYHLEVTAAATASAAVMWVMLATLGLHAAFILH